MPASWKRYPNQDSQKHWAQGVRENGVSRITSWFLVKWFVDGPAIHWDREQRWRKMSSVSDMPS